MAFDMFSLIAIKLIEVPWKILLDQAQIQEEISLETQACLKY